MVSLTFFGGIDEIGGNKFLIEDKKTRIFLDFGQSFSLLDDYFVDWLQPRTSRFGLRDFFALGLMPKLPGLYNKNTLEKTNLAYQEPDYDAVFISHPHFDHTAHLQFLDPKIPIYMGETCKEILESTQRTTKSFFFSDEEKEKRDGSIVEKNELHTFRTGQKITVGSIIVTPIHVDHSVPGAYGFLVETSEGTIVYTGDLRSHGAKPKLTQDFLQAAGKTEPELLIIEGTRVANKESRQNHSEKTVQEGSEKIAKETEGMLLAMRYPKDMDRLRTFFEAAKKSNRELVVSLKTAHLLQTLRNDGALNMPAPGKDVKIYVREMKKEDKWQKELQEEFADSCVDSDWVKKNQKNAVLELDFSQMNELIDIEPKKGGACLHSMSEPFEEDPMSQLQDDVLKNWLMRFGMPHHQLHASGHAGMGEIFAMVEALSPKRVAPVHTQHAELFAKKGKVEVKKGQKIEL